MDLQHLGELVADSHDGAVERTIAINPAVGVHDGRVKTPALDMFDPKNGFDPKTKGVRWVMVWLLDVSGDPTVALPVNPALAAGASGTVQTFDSPTALLQSGAVDAVIIATPHYLHPPLAIAALKGGIHALVEKPAGVYTKQVKEMNEVAEQSGKIFARRRAFSGCTSGH